MQPPTIFDRALRHIRFAHAEALSRDDRWLTQRMTMGAVERLDVVSRPFSDALIIGLGFDLLAPELQQRRISASALAAGRDEDLPFAPAASADLIIACGTLDTVNDLPGALALVRRTLRPGGLFLGSMIGAGSLSGLRALIAKAEQDGPATARFHPMIDVRAAGDLLARAGFVLPVAESETINASYRSLDRLRRDMKGSALSNCLTSRTSLPKAQTKAIRQGFDAPFDESFTIISMTGWSPEG
jgi:SAM-dependent methyltransferase